MTHVRLLHEERRTGTAQLEELENVESSGASKHVADVCGLQARQGFDIQFRQPLLTAPTHYPSLKRIGCIGVGRGAPSELRAVPERLDHFLGAGTPALPAFARSPVGGPGLTVAAALARGVDLCVGLF